MFEFCVFCCPSVLLWNGVEIRLPHKARVVLTVLACAKDFTVPAGTLVKLLSHGDPTDAAADTLRSWICLTRNLIKKVAGEAAAKALLGTLPGQGGASYRLSTKMVTIDFREWEPNLAAARDELAWRPSREAEAALAVAVAGWRDTAFGDAEQWQFARDERQWTGPGGRRHPHRVSSAASERAASRSSGL